MPELGGGRTGRVLEFENVSFGYESGSGGQPVVALRDVSFTMAAGSIHGLVGVNGAGKTTLLEIAAGTLEPDTGNVRIGGVDAGSPRRSRDLLEVVGFCPDVPSLPSRLTVSEVFRYFGALKGLSREALAPRIDFLSSHLGLESQADRRVEELSRGNLVRVGVALSALDAPDLLLFDESFGPLDPLVAKELRELLKKLAGQGAAVLISSHQLGQLEKVVEYVHVIHEGVLTGPFAPEHFRSQRFLRVGVDRMSVGKRRELRQRFPGSTLVDDTLLVPWAEGDEGEERVTERLSADGFPEVEVRGTVERSLESVLIDVVEGSRDSDD